MKSPLLLPITLIIAGVLAFMAMTGVLPPTLFRLWPVIFVILGVVGLISLSSEELMGEERSARKATSKAAARPAASAKASTGKKKVAKKSTAKKSRKK